LDNLVVYIESLVFAADHPITRNDVRYALENCFETQISPEEIDSAVDHLIDKYGTDDFAIEVNEIGGGLQFMTKPAFHHVIGSHLKLITKRRLSRVALETLAIIAYKQPVTKTELEKIRGVSCDYAIQKLLEKELVLIAGRAEGPGRPLLYSTSPKFMDYLGLRDIKDLPKLRELEQTDNSIGESAPVEIVEASDSDQELPENGQTPESGSTETQPSGSDAVNVVEVAQGLDDGGKLSGQTEDEGNVSRDVDGDVDAQVEIMPESEAVIDDSEE